MFSIEKKEMEKKGSYFLALTGGLFAFASLMGFIGSPQHTSSHVSQPQGSSIRTTSPQFSHLYFSPLFFTKKFAFLKLAIYYSVFYKYKVRAFVKSKVTEAEYMKILITKEKKKF
jgi:hypothetical protein